MKIKPKGCLALLAILAIIAAFVFRARIGPAIGRVADFAVSIMERPTPTAVAVMPTPAEPGATAVPARPTPVPGEELSSFVVGLDAFASYYNVPLIEQLGLDEKYGFDLQMITFCSTEDNCFTEDERSEKLASGEWDAMLTTLDKLALNPDIGKLTALVDETDGADKVVVNPERIATINDLRGRRISFMGGSIGEFFVYYLLNLVRIPPTEVELYPSEDVIVATDLYVNDWVDAVSGWEPDVDASIDSGGNVLIDSGRLRVVVDVLLTSNQAISQRPEVTQAFHNAWFEALKFQFEDPQKAEELIITWGNNDWSYVEAEGDLQGWLETIAQAGLGANQIAMRDKTLLAGRLEEAKHVWQWAGKVIPDVNLEELIEPQFVLTSAENPNLQPLRAPINDTFLLTAKPDIPKLTEEELGGATILAILPLKKIEFEPDSTRLTEKARTDLKEQVLPVLRSSTELYLKVEGSSAWPGPGKYTEEHIRNFAYERALSVAQFLAGQGIDPDRLVLGTVDPKFPESQVEEELEQDRFVAFTLIQPLGR